MEASKCIRERASIREYSKDAISKEELTELVDLANKAPTASHAQNRMFVIATDGKTKEKLDIASGNQGHIKTAAAVIAVLTKPKWMKKEQLRANCKRWEFSVKDETFESMFDKWEYLWGVQDAALASENLMLGAWDKGIGSCFVGLFDEPEVKKLLGIPADYLVTALITLGKFSGVKYRVDRKPASELIRWEKW